MLAEIEHIDNDEAAVAFALGCMWASYLERIRSMAKLTNLIRWGAAAIIAAGALNMIYFAVEPASRFLPTWQLLAMNLKGFAYLAAALALASERLRLFVYLLVAELLTVALSWGALYLEARSAVYPYSRAIILEDTITISTVMAIAFLTRKILRARQTAA
jgi:hypothetical protein